MPSIQTISTALLAFVALSNAASLRIIDTGTPSGCGRNSCCIPSCTVIVDASLGVSGSVAWSGTCRQNSDNPSGTQDVGDGHQMTWLREESGQVVIDVFNKSDKKYDRWAVNNCVPIEDGGGSQCAPSGGGCDATQTLFGAQG